VVTLEGWDGRYALRLTEGAPVRAHTVLIATGARYRRLEIPGLDRFERSGVYYAATAVEAMRCRDQAVVVVGDGDAAGQAAVLLAEHAASVRLVIRGDDLAASMSRYLADRIDRDGDIEVLTGTEITDVAGDDSLAEVGLRRGGPHGPDTYGPDTYEPDGSEPDGSEPDGSGPVSRVEAQGLFVFLGAQANTGWLGDILALDQDGFIRTGPDLVALPAMQGESGDVTGRGFMEPGRPFPLESSLPGVFAAGDVRDGSVKRVAAAVGEGAMAVRFVHELRDW
jgi:thioredoxin reductase (NADPH)